MMVISWLFLWILLLPSPTKSMEEIMAINRSSSKSTSSASPSATTTKKLNRFTCQSNLYYDFLDIDRFTDNMCAQCVWFMAGTEAPWLNFDSVKDLHVQYNFSDNINVKICSNETNCQEFKYESLKQSNNSIIMKLKSSFYKHILLDCCEQARHCCQDMLSMSKDFDPDRGGGGEGGGSGGGSGKRCPPTWDGFMCWESALPGTVNFKQCPSMTYAPLGIKPTQCRNEIANKECWPNGRWARINRTRFDEINKIFINYTEEYTNYLPCSTPGSTHKLKFIRVSIVFQLISLLLTIVGWILLKTFPMKTLPKLCEIHINFLISLIFTSSLSLCVLIFIKERHYRLNSMIDKNPIWCRILMILMKSVRLTNYCWMLNEAIILWQMVVRPLPVNNIKMNKFNLIGWMFPILVMIFYSSVRLSGEYNKSCWTKSMGYWELIYNIPTISVIIINFILLIYMIYILLKKMSASQDSHLRTSVGKSLVLVPVFGIHYVFYIRPFDPFESCANYLFIFQYIMLITEALQGAMVATIFCFFNKEVRANIVKKFCKKRRDHFQRSKSIATNDFTAATTATMTSTTTTTRIDEEEEECTEMVPMMMERE